MAYSSETAQETRRGFLDPRTKLALVLVLAMFVMGGLGGDQLKGIKTILSVLPFLLLLIERQWKRFARGVAMLVIGYGLLLAMPYLPGVLNYIALMCWELDSVSRPVLQNISCAQIASARPKTISV